MVGGTATGIAVGVKDIAIGAVGF